RVIVRREVAAPEQRNARRREVERSRGAILAVRLRFARREWSILGLHIEENAGGAQRSDRTETDLLDAGKRRELALHRLILRRDVLRLSVKVARDFHRQHLVAVQARADD